MKTSRHAALLALLLPACSGPAATPGGGGAGGAGGGAQCTSLPTLEAGDPNGHADPLGAKAAGQARAGRVASADQIVQPAHGRQQIAVGDYVLANDRIAVYVEDKGDATRPSDGYARFGGEILAIDRVGDDGRPLGESTYGETLQGVVLQAVEPTSVTVLTDGSDGGDAVVRVLGPLAPIPFLDEAFGLLFPDIYPFQVAYDYVLSPGATSVRVRLSIVNQSSTAFDLGDAVGARKLLFGFFHSSRNQLVTREFGFAEPTGLVDWVGFDGPLSSFGFRSPTGQLEFGLSQSGFQMFWAPGVTVDGCGTADVELIDLAVSGPGHDQLVEAMGELAGDPPGREITGTVLDASGQPVPRAWVVALEGGAFSRRTRAAADGTYALHAPNGDVTLVPVVPGYPPHAGTLVPAASGASDLSFAATGTLHVEATEQGTATPLPVRVQVIPVTPVAGIPGEYGVANESNGRLYQALAHTGSVDLVLPPGEHRVIVSRGYEWELHDETVTVTAGATTDVTAALEHGVSTPDVMCGDFHIHSWFSADSDDSPVEKVKAAVVDGLDVPVSSEHEWCIDFKPYLADLGLSSWAYGMSSEELTTFTWGHFGVVPLIPDASKLNNGAVDWVGKTPTEVFAEVQALPEDPVLIVNHPRGAAFGAYFTASQLDRDTGTGADGFYSDNFDAIEVFNDSDFESNREEVVEDWFALLRMGKRVSAVGSSDSHRIRSSPVGYPRTCMQVGTDDPLALTDADVRDALAAGRSTISGGYYLTVLGPGGEGPGDVVATGGAPATFTLRVEHASWVPAPEHLEVFLDGQSVAIEDLVPVASGSSAVRYELELDVSKAAGVAESFVVFHVKGSGDLSPVHPGRSAFAVSNAVFLQ